MAHYIFEHQHWPHFSWDSDRIAPALAALRYRQGLFAQRRLALDAGSRDSAAAMTLSDEARSGALLGGKRGPGTTGGLKAVFGDIAQNPAALLTAARIFAWQRMLEPGAAGSWRAAEAAYPAPAAARLTEEMKIFLAWFNFDALPQSAAPRSALWNEPVIRAGIAQLWLMCLRPFENGSGRLARCVCALALARADSGKAWYSLNGSLLEARDSYYAMIDKSRRGGLDITPWLEWFLGALDNALENADELAAPALKRGRAVDKMQKSPLGERQKAALSMLLDGSIKEISSGAYAKAAGCSGDTALRDIQELLALGLLRKNRSGGRSTSYSLKL